MNAQTPEAANLDTYLTIQMDGRRCARCQVTWPCRNDRLAFCSTEIRRKRVAKAAQRSFDHEKLRMGHYPDFETFCRLSAGVHLVPVFRRLL